MRGATAVQQGPAGGDALPLAAHEWAADAGGPPLVLLHATGFHGGVWRAVVAALGRRHVLAPDQRGHGGSDAAPLTDWRDFARDLLALLEARGIEGATLVGHSLGGAVALMAAAEAPGRIARLVLIDPVVPSPEAVRAGVNPMATPPDGSHPIARRRARFADAAEMQAVLGPRPPFAAFDPRVLADYCAGGVRPEGDGVTLACAPGFEAQVYDRMLAAPVLPELLAQVRQPALVVRAREAATEAETRDFRFSPTWPGLAATLPRGRDLHLPQATHFLPMEAPDFTAGLILAAEAALA